jgi:heptosyltransferase-2
MEALRKSALRRRTGLAYPPGMNTSHEQPRRGSATGQSSGRILVVCTRYIGDTVLAIPFLRNLRRAFPDATIDVCAEGGSRMVLADCPYVDELVSWDRPAGRRNLATSLAAIRRQAAWLQSRGYERAYLLKRSFSGSLLAMLAGIPRRIGFAADGRMLLTTTITPARGRHQAARYLDLLRADGIPVDDGHNENWVTPDAGAEVAGLLESLPADRPRVFVAMRSTAKEKHWPADRWAVLLTRLVMEHGSEIVLCGSAADVAAHEAVREMVGPLVAAHLHDFSRHVPLRSTGALLARMDALVGVDTGLVHLAASYGLPVVVLFGPTDPNRWSPWSPRATVLRSAAVRRPLLDRLGLSRQADTAAWQTGTADLADIGVGEVLAAITATLPERAKPAIRTIDLREGGFRYEVVGGKAATPHALAAARPAR